MYINSTTDFYVLCKRGYLTIFCRYFFVSQYRKTSKGNPLVLHKISLSKSFMHKRGYHDFLSEIVCLTVPKIFVGEPFCVSEKFCRKVLCIRGGYHNFLSQIVCLIVTKNVVGEPFLVQINSGIETYHA